jgi:hypothetical protein
VRSRLLFFALLVGCSSGGASPAAAPQDSGTPVEHDDPCGADPAATAMVPSTRVATIRSKKTPLATPGKSNPIDPAGLATYLAQGLGEWEAGPGEPGVVLDTLLPGSGGTAGIPGRKSIAYIAQLSDTQLADDESPTRLMAYDTPTIGGAGRPQEASVGLVTSAMHRTLAAISKKRPFDFEVVTGDCADNSQENEIDWVRDLMDGKPGLHIDSGDDDDPVPGPGNDPKDPFDPVPAPAPWYFVFGNHDVELQGTSIVDDGVRTSAVGVTPSNGTRDYRRKGAPVTREDVPADPHRRPIVRGEVVLALQKGTGTPAGHGFAGVAVSGPPANYVVDPIPGTPLRMVQLDTSDPYGGSEGMVLQKTVDDFLEPTLKKADADHVMVILASHHSTTNIDTGRGLESTPVPGALTGAAVEAIVAKHPSVVLWLVGHNHRNRVRAVAGPSTDAPGYWEVMTSAIADFPSQARAIELVHEPKSDSLSIFLTMIDFEAKSCLEARYRTWSLVDVNSGWSHDGSGVTTDRNVELRLRVPAGVTLAGLGKDTIETETTLVAK